MKSNNILPNTVLSGFKTLSFSTAWCCLIRMGNGTSSSLVQPPSGCKRSTGLLYPLSNSFWWVSCINNACPLWIGLRNWNAKTASACMSWNFLRNSFGLKRYSSKPSCQLISSTKRTKTLPVIIHINCARTSKKLTFLNPRYNRNVGVCIT